MPFEGLATFIQINLFIWLFAFAGLFIYQVRKSELEWSGLVNQIDPGTKSGGGLKSRVQHLLTVLIVAIIYTFSALHEITAAAEPLKALPDIPEELLFMLGGSSIGYISIKAKMSYKI